MLGLGRVITCTIATLLCLARFVHGEKFKLCVVGGKSSRSKLDIYCPYLDQPDSKVECVVALDRLDCLRQLSKGKVDFSVFTAEDLVTAQNSKIEVLVTNEIRYNANDDYEYEVVAIVNNNAGIKSRHELKGKRFCHPGYGYKTDWTKILANFFESSVATPSCDTQLTITENRIKATAEFFKAACKAGPWVNNQNLDRELKKKYPHLCELCGDPLRCNTNDKYWGKRGSLLCLTDGVGDVSWARLDDVKPHFDLQSEVSTSEYSFLCPDDTLMPMNVTNLAKPCVWVAKPWPVVASRRSVAQDIQEIVSSLSKTDNGWKNSLLKLLEIAYTTFKKVDSLESIESYLRRSTGYLSANSFSGCHPPRTINICTTSIVENAKCAWMRESAAVYGLEPDIECIKADNTTHCMLALNLNAADVVMVPSDLIRKAKSDYHLTTLFYEETDSNEKYVTVAVTKPGSNIKTFEDLRGKKACFPVYDGVAWNTVKSVLFNKQLIKECPLDNEMAQFFGPSCTPGLPNSVPDSMKKICQNNDFNGDLGALHCLSSGIADVAFVSNNSITKFVSDENNPSGSLKREDFQILCDSKSTPCYLSWASIGQGMIRSNSSDLWKKDTVDVFLQLDNLFGKYYQSLTTPFTMFGKYDGISNLLFHDATMRLRSVAVQDSDTMAYPYENSLNTEEMCIKSKAPATSYNSYVLFFISAISVISYLN